MANSIELLKQAQTSYSANANKQTKTNAVSGETQSSAANVSNTDTLEISTSAVSDTVDEKSDYKKANASEIEAMQKQAELTAQNLKAMVNKLILKQSKNANLAGMHGKNVSQTDAASIEQASLAISEDGEYGVKAVSDRIVDFAVKISGGDTTKLDELKTAIKKGFDQAGIEFGRDLPSISNRTYDAVMKKLDDWAGVDTAGTSSVSA